MNIYPSYQCNLACSFCSLRNRPGAMIDLDWLETQLKEQPGLCSDINILGGEPSILPYDYQKRLIEICTTAAGEKPFFITNLYRISPFLQYTRPVISYDFNLRQHQETILHNLLSLDMEFALSTIMTDNLIQLGANKLLTFVDRLKRCRRVDLLLYRQGDTTRDHSPDHRRLMAFVAEVIAHPKINVTPYSAMKGYTDNSFENLAGRMGFLPDNKYGVRIDYRNCGYTVFNSYHEAVAYYKMRVEQIKHSALCGQCEFVGKCWCVGGYEDGVCHGDRIMMEYFKSL